MRSNRNIHPIAVNDLLSCLAMMLSLAATGCVSSAPAWTASRAVHAAEKGKLIEFRSQLTDEARCTLGTVQGMDAIRQKLAHYTNLSIGPELLVSSEQGDQGYGHLGDVRRSYKSIVAGSPQKGVPAEAIYSLILKCWISYGEVHHDEVAESCTTTIDDNGVPWTNCSGGSPAYDSIDYGESCWVARIEDAKESSSE